MIRIFAGSVVSVRLKMMSAKIKNDEWKMIFQTGVLDYS
jgi:hypothetical protein